MKLLTREEELELEVKYFQAELDYRKGKITEYENEIKYYQRKLRMTIKEVELRTEKLEKLKVQLKSNI